MPSKSFSTPSMSSSNTNRSEAKLKRSSSLSGSGTICDFEWYTVPVCDGFGDWLFDRHQLETPLFNSKRQQQQYSRRRAALTAAMSFWTKLAKPIYCVAPMANVTDVAFRRIITDLAKPTVSKPFCRGERSALCSGRVAVMLMCMCSQCVVAACLVGHVDGVRELRGSHA